jgi:hypothetical protein
MAWKAVVAMAIATAPNPATRNGSSPRSIRYANPSSHLRMNHQAIGEASALAKRTGLVNCQIRSLQTSKVDAPSALRMPISFVRRSAAWADNPSERYPLHELKQDEPGERELAGSDADSQ